MNEEKIRQQMEEVIELFKEDIATIRTGRATPALIENISVSVYGGQQKLTLKELGTINVTGPRALSFQPWDVSIIAEIKNGILNSGAGLNPVIDNNIIRLSLPPLTQEQREDYLKLLGRKTEAARVMIRDIRTKERYQLQQQLREKQISEDEFHRLEEQLQKITDEFIEKIDQIAAEKEKEIRGEA
ncbi:ribosome recycling factor [bacterium]|nr:ribosome recycling factor [bacterium]